MPNFLKKLLGKKDSASAGDQTQAATMEALERPTEVATIETLDSGERPTEATTIESLDSGESPTQATTIEDLDPQRGDQQQQQGRGGGGAFVAFPIPPGIPGLGGGDDNAVATDAASAGGQEALEDGRRALREEGYGLESDGGGLDEGRRALREEGYGLEDRQTFAQSPGAEATPASPPPAPSVSEAVPETDVISGAEAQEALQQAAQENAAAQEALQQAAQENTAAQEALQQAAQENAEAQEALEQAAQEHAAAEQALQQAAEEQAEVEPAAEEPEPADSGEDADVDDESSTLLDMETSADGSPVPAGFPEDTDIETGEDLDIEEDVDADGDSLDL